MIKPDLIDPCFADPAEEPLRRAGSSRGFVYVNPTGKFVIRSDRRRRRDGPRDHRRHLRGAAPHGSGAFSGRTRKVDRSAAYAARYVANVISRVADRCLIQVAYAIGSRARSPS
jgi:S-adenosylmethionine synthetase